MRANHHRSNRLLSLNFSGPSDHPAIPRVHPKRYTSESLAVALGQEWRGRWPVGCHRRKHSRSVDGVKRIGAVHDKVSVARIKPHTVSPSG